MNLLCMPFIGYKANPLLVIVSIRSEWKNIEMTPRNIRCITNTVFRDNLGISLHNFPIKPVDNPILLPNLKGPSDCLILLGKFVRKKIHLLSLYLLMFFFFLLI